MNSKLNVFRMMAVIFLALTISGCAGSKMQKSQRMSLEPQSDKALVTFLRPAIFFADGMDIEIWDTANFVGSLSAGTYVQYLAEPGPHVFMAEAENWSYVKADLQGGKHYYILGKMFPGILVARVAIDPVKKGSEDAGNMEKFMAKLTPMAIAPEKLGNYVQAKRDSAKAAADKIASSGTTYGTLLKEDGI